MSVTSLKKKTNAAAVLVKKKRKEKANKKSHNRRKANSQQISAQVRLTTITKCCLCLYTATFDRKVSLKYHKHYKRLISVKGNLHTEKRTTEQVIRLKINFFWCVSNTALEKKYVELCPPLNIFAREWHWLVSIEKNKTKKVLFDSSKPYPTEAFAYEHTHTHTHNKHTLTLEVSTSVCGSGK